MKKQNTFHKNRESLLNNLIRKMEEDSDKLPLSKTSRDIVPPEGNSDAEIMFIGEAAGYHEHVKRRPFVGPAGKLLTQTLENIGIKRSEVWISNILKVRPPQNRDPLPEEIDAYKEYLDTEIQIIKPKVIVTLGRFSMAKFLPNTYISQIHGQARWVDWQGERLLVFPMYHPAAALRNGQVMDNFIKDFEKLKQLLDTLNKQNKEKETSSEKISEDKMEDQQLQLI